MLHKVNNACFLSKSTHEGQYDHSGNLPMSEIDQSWPDEGRARKRVRLSSDHEHSAAISRAQSLFLRINRLLTGQDTSEVEGLSDVAPYVQIS